LHRKLQTTQRRGEEGGKIGTERRRKRWEVTDEDLLLVLIRSKAEGE